MKRVQALDHLALMLLPVQGVLPLLLKRVPHPEALEGSELLVGGKIGRDQQERAAASAASLLAESEVPLANGALVSVGSESHRAEASPRTNLSLAAAHAIETAT